MASDAAKILYLLLSTAICRYLPLSTVIYHYLLSKACRKTIGDHFLPLSTVEGLSKDCRRPKDRRKTVERLSKDPLKDHGKNIKPSKDPAADPLPRGTHFQGSRSSTITFGVAVLWIWLKIEGVILTFQGGSHGDSLR